jgi:molybdopterin-guanine dinucleotide biosynthesis protein A
MEAGSFVLAGGRSTRMGQDKALLRIGGRSLLERALDKLPGARIAGARSDLSSFAPVIPDIHPDCGPLSGIEAALTASRSAFNVFLPVDMPLLPARFLPWMVERARITGALATVPRILGRPQPLCAVYQRDLLPSITAALESGQFKVMAAVGRADLFDVEVLASTDRELPGFSALPVHRWFHNCNTPEDALVLEP